MLALALLLPPSQRTVRGPPGAIEPYIAPRFLSAHGERFDDRHRRPLALHRLTTAVRVALVDLQLRLDARDPWLHWSGIRMGPPGAAVLLVIMFYLGQPHMRGRSRTYCAGNYIRI